MNPLAQLNQNPCRIFVTGAGGFIGSHLVEALVKGGHHVTALVHYNAMQNKGNLELIDEEVRSHVEIIVGDICDPEQMQAAVEGHDVILNLAALIGIPYSYQAPRSYLRTNVEGVMNLLEAARRHGANRFIHVSTSEVYGSARTIPMDERHPLQAQSPYSASKIGADAMVEAYRRNFNVPAVIMRPFNTYGPRQSERAVIPTIIGQALRGAKVRMGAMDTIRDFTFVEDTVEALVMAALLPQLDGGPYNLGTGEGVSIAALAARIFQLLGVEPELEADPRRLRPADGEVDRLVSDNRLWHGRSGWAPRTPLDIGLQKTIDAMRRAPRSSGGEYMI